jgi:hypothetical protein
MTRSFAVFAALAVFGTMVMTLAGHAGHDQNEPAPPTKADGPGIRPSSLNCSSEVWPAITASCLHSTGPGALLEARLVGARR